MKKIKKIKAKEQEEDNWMIPDFCAYPLIYTQPKASCISQ